MGVHCQMSSSNVFQLRPEFPSELWEWMDDSYLSRGRWVSDFWLSSVLAHYWYILSASACSHCPGLATGIYSWKGCVCVYVGGGGEGWWIGERKDIWQGTVVLLDFMFSIPFSVHIWTLTLETPKPRIGLFFYGTANDNSTLWQIFSNCLNWWEEGWYSVTGNMVEPNGILLSHKKKQCHLQQHGWA